MERTWIATARKRARRCGREDWIRTMEDICAYWEILLPMYMRWAMQKAWRWFDRNHLQAPESFLSLAQRLAEPEDPRDENGIVCGICMPDLYPGEIIDGPGSDLFNKEEVKEPSRKYKFFFHYYRQYDDASVHFRGKCMRVRDVELYGINVVKSKHRKRQPYWVVEGLCESIVVRKGVAIIT
jgi:hypothetical protein